MPHATRPSRFFGSPRASGTAAVLGVCVSATNAWAQQPAWLREFGGSSDDWAGALLKTGRDGAIVAGGTLGSLFSPSLGSEDAFLAWFDEGGNLIAGVQFGTNSTDSAIALAPAAAAGVFVAGATQGSFGAPNAGGWDAWVAQCDGVGNRLWVRQLGSGQSDQVYALAEDASGGVFVTGYTHGDLAGQIGAVDAWVARYDGSVARHWLIQFGTTNIDLSVGACPDGYGGCFIGGTTVGALFGAQVGDADAWIARFDSRGQLLWGRQFGTPQLDTGRALSADGLGGAFIAGSTQGMMAGSVFGGAWLARYDTMGTQLSIMQFGGGPAGSVEAVAADGLGGAFLAGTTTGSLGGPNAGGNDVWVARILGGTGVAWIDQFGSSAYEEPFALALAGPGSVFAAGYTQGNLAPGGGGFNDAWLARYDTCYPDCTGDGAQTVADFGCFQGKYVLGDPYADCNGSGALTIADFGCFQGKYVLGCP
ncbi:MAG: SBBP repeat-containing protein [Phycisphaerales bacterium]